MKVVNFFFKVSILVTVLQLLFGAIVNPKVLNYSRSLIGSSSLDFISSMLKSNQFNDTVEGLTVYFEEKNENDIMKNLFIRDDNQILKGLDKTNDASNITIFAKRGKVIEGNKNYLYLEEGTIQSQNLKKEIQSINFKNTKLLLEGMKTKSITQPKIQETSSYLLIKCLGTKEIDTKILNCPKKKSKIDALAEINRRFGMPLYIPCVSLLCSFLLISRNESRRKGLYKYLYFGLAFIILILAEILVRYSGKAFSYSYVYYLLPTLTVPILYFMLSKNFNYENARK